MKSNSTIDREHEAKMKEIELNHKKAMAELQTQTDLENEKHNEIMKQIEKQTDKFNVEVGIDIAELSGNFSLLN